jgi:hypothetical protein
MPEIVDNIYGGNPVFFRINAANKKMVTGGTQIEAPLMYSRFTSGGPYSGYDVLPTVPQDTIKNGAWDWRQQAVLVVVDGLTLIKTDSPDSIANYITQYFQQAEMEMAANLGTGLWSSGTDPKEIDGFGMAVDDGGVAPTYAGITRAANTWWNAQDDSTSAALTLPVLQSMFSNTQAGGRHPTLIASRKEQYNRYWNLNTSQQRYPVAAMGHDEQLASAGFTNLLFNNVPWVQDPNVFDGPNTSNSAIVFLNEDFITFAVSPRADFYLEDFQTPVNQDAMVAKLLWAGNLVVTNCALQGKLSNISA